MVSRKQPYISELKSSLDGFLDLLDRVEGMETYSSLYRLFKGADPTVRLYRGDILMASSTPSDYRAFQHLQGVRDIAYRFLKGLRKHAEPLSVTDMDHRERWGGLSGTMAQFIERSMKNLEVIGVVRSEGKDRYNWTRFKLVTTDGFRIEYKKPRVPTPIRSLSDLRAKNKEDRDQLRQLHLHR